MTAVSSWLKLECRNYTGALFAFRDEVNNTIKVWLFSQGKTNPVATIGLPIGDCICRFGLPTEVLSFSPDGQHLAVGCVAGKGRRR